MGFFARPNLDDDQFKQLTGTTLTLSGTTNFVGTLKSKGVEIDGTATSYGQVLTYDGSKIKLMPGGGGGSAYYSGASPSTCTVGGLVANTILTGKTVSKILEEILVPTLNPLLSSPYSTFSIVPSTSPLEVGTVVNITGSLSLNQGSISPAYCGGPSVRSGPAVAYAFSQYGAPSVTGASSSCLFASHTTLYGTVPNTSSAFVYYSAGGQPLNSSGGNYGSPCPAGNTNNVACGSTLSQSIMGMYPYFWGTSSSAPTAGQTLLNSGTCVVASSSGDIPIDFNVGTPSKYLWFAIPTSYSVPKTLWIGSNSVMNTEGIPGYTFGSPIVVPGMNSPTPASPSFVPWTNLSYSFYISNFATNTCPLSGTYYTITFKNS